MALLDLQDMKAPQERWHEGSDVSLLLCDSGASLTLCV